MKKLTKDEKNAAGQALEAAEARAQAWRNTARQLRGERVGEWDDVVADPEPTPEKCDRIAELTEEGIAVLRRLLKTQN
jgi:hypothetical protein